MWSFLCGSLLCLYVNGFQVYDEARIQRQFGAALATVKQILNTTRHPQFAVDVPHTYQDKYSLAEFLTNTAIAAEVNALSAMGLKPGKANRVRDWANNNNQAVSIGFRARQSCAYLRNESAQVGSPQQVTTVTTNGKDTSTTKQTFTTVVTYFYTWSLSWQLVAYRGTASSAALDGNNNNDNNNVNDARMIPLDARNITFTVKTTTNYAPYTCVNQVYSNMDLDLTWLFKNLDNNNNPKFVIDRNDPDCHTPRRNDAVDEAVEFFGRVNAWSNQAVGKFPGWSTTRVASDVFVPVIPLFENTCSSVSAPAPAATGTTAQQACTGRVALSAADLNVFLAEQDSSLRAAAVEASNTFGPRSNSSAQISEVEAQMTVSLNHQRNIAEAYQLGVNSIEGMLRDQLVAAIGKEVSPQDFGEYIRFNNRRMFKPLYRPQELSYAVRRPEHYPEGVVEIQQSDSSLPLPFPIQSMVRVDRPVAPMNATLSGGTVISLMGDRYLHAAVFYQFSGQTPLDLKLAARARQFSSFVLLVGTLVSANEFRPDIGIIIKDKDDLTIPLLLETLPTPQAFRDAIESLSPEQQAFAKAFRSMQLSSTLFAFAIIQVKPQLEKLMKLPSDSLTKEIQLTQDLMRLFLDYQIPSDLLSFQGVATLEPQAKIDYVRAQVGKMNEFIEAEKAQQIKEKQQKDEMTRLEAKPQMDYAYLGGGVMASMAAAPVRARGSIVERSMPMPRPVSPPASSAFSSPPGDAPHASLPPYSPPTPGSSRPASPTTPSKQVATSKMMDYTTIPAALDARVLALDDDASLRATIIKPGSNWYRQSQKGLLGERSGATLTSDLQTSEKQKAFDLLEALSKSGIMGFEEAEFHVVIGSTQNFDDTILDTVIQQNENPIDQFERSNLIVASTVLGLPAVDLVAQDQVPRLAAFSPKLFPDATALPNQ